MLKVIIAEDDPAMRIVLKRVLNEIPGLEVTGEAENGRQLVGMVEQMKPDIVFVDVDMPEMNGIEASKEIFDINPKIFIIFATAFDNYTHEAFRVYAFDYLVKPFKLNRIRQTMERIKALKAGNETNGSLEPATTRISKDNKKLVISINDTTTFVNTQDIILITREERKTVIYTAQGTVKVSETLNQLEEQLNTGNFFRCHKGYIINADMVKQMQPWGKKTYMVILANTEETALMTHEKAREYRIKYGLP